MLCIWGLTYSMPSFLYLDSVLTLEPQLVTKVTSEEPNSVDNDAEVDESSYEGSDVP